MKTANSIRRVAIFGATSAMAQETARRFAGRGCELFLVGRNEERLKILAQDLQIRGAARVAFDVTDFDHFESHADIIEKADAFLNPMDAALIAYGILPLEEECRKDFKAAERVLRTNFLSCLSLLALLADCFKKRRSGVIAVISSVAGDRGRQSNFVYGTSKAALSFYCQGLRNYLFPFNVAVTTIKPGYIDTPMTQHLKKNFLFFNPSCAGRAIYRAMIRRQDIAYVPAYWRLVMMLIGMIPESLFKRMKL